MHAKIPARNLLIAFLSGALQAFGMYHIHARREKCGKMNCRGSHNA